MSLHRHRVLVLNKLWTAVNVITLRRAMILLFKERAKVVLPDKDFQTFTWEDWAALRPKDGEDFIKSVRMKFKIPEIVVLNDYDQNPAHKVTFNRRAIYKRDNHCCIYCGKQFPPSDCNVDHIVPRSKGGLTTWTNCGLTCIKCNSKKDNRTPEEAGMSLLWKPYKPKWCPFKLEKKPLKSWRHFLTNFDELVSEAYWNIELENDN